MPKNLPGHCHQLWRSDFNFEHKSNRSQMFSWAENQLGGGPDLFLLFLGAKDLALNAVEGWCPWVEHLSTLPELQLSHAMSCSVLLCYPLQGGLKTLAVSVPDPLVDRLVWSRQTLIVSWQQYLATPATSYVGKWFTRWVSVHEDMAEKSEKSRGRRRQMARMRDASPRSYL
jgi:hypothetical protein